MKTTYLTIALMLGMAAVPVMAAGPAWNEAVALSAQDSKVSMADLCNAVYRAAKESPNEAVKLYETVLAQRTTWNASQCYAILRSILLALPGDIACNIGKYTQKYQDAKGSAVKGEKVQRAHYSAAIESSSVSEETFYGLIDVLYNASLAEGVADNTFASIYPTVSGVYETSFNAAVNTDAGRGDTNGMLPTPPPTSEDL